jgi:putative flippase GtrA
VGAPLLPSQAAGFTAGFLNSFILNSLVTFRMGRV